MQYLQVQSCVCLSIVPTFTNQHTDRLHDSAHIAECWGDRCWDPSWYSYSQRRDHIALPPTSFVQFSSVQSLSHVQLFATSWTAARQASLSIANSRSLLKLKSIESVMPSNQLVLCHSLLLLPSLFPSYVVVSKRTERPGVLQSIGSQRVGHEESDTTGLLNNNKQKI